MATRLIIAATLVVLGFASAAFGEDLSGRWRGSWESESTGHQGPLRARFIARDDNQYDVVFSGRFFKVLPFRYRVTLDVVEEGPVTRLQGSSYLGRLFGTFSYQAEASGGNFTAHYSSCKDDGTFCLQRVCAPCTAK